MQGNFGFASTLLDTLKKYGNKAPVMLSSSQQASLTGRFGNSEYGRSKKAGEDLFLQYGEENGVEVFIYRFPNLFGKWCRPNYNSAVATFCNNIANDLPIQVNDRNVEMELLYVDDLVEEMIGVLQAYNTSSSRIQVADFPHRCEFEGLEVVPKVDGRYCYCPVTFKTTLGEIVDLLYQFAEMPKTLMIPEISADSFGGNFYLEASTLFRGTNGVDYPAEFIIPNCRIQSNFTFSMASTGDPSTFTFTLDAFPDYTRWDKTKKVLAAIQIIEDAGAGVGGSDYHRGSTNAQNGNFDSKADSMIHEDDQAYDGVSYDAANITYRGKK